MRDTHLKAIDQKLATIRRQKRLGQKIVTWLFRILLICLLFLIFSAFGNLTMMLTDLLDQTNYIRQEVENIDAWQENPPEVNSVPLNSIGEYAISHYCSCEKCCGKSDGITASGTIATEGRTIAVTRDSQIPLGSTVVIDGHSYIAEDLMASSLSGNLIDIYCDDHSEALSRGVFEREVYR